MCMVRQKCSFVFCQACTALEVQDIITRIVKMAPLNQSMEVLWVSIVGHARVCTLKALVMKAIHGRRRELITGSLHW